MYDTVTFFKICEYIKERVRRPKKVAMWADLMRFNVSRKCRTGYCPLGLLPTAKKPTPVKRADFTSLPKWIRTEDLVDFWSWWDTQRDINYAMDTIWGETNGQ